MGINEIIMYIMMFFMLIAAVDRILSQFGGSARFLGKFGKSIEGSGGQFEEGFMAMGALALHTDRRTVEWGGKVPACCDRKPAWLR
ncbi:ethanolamine utilization protein EutH, partial [Pseudomonas aeruginosa]|uniref:ethanolamine utilization protein EutH n=1 Tax=Pseudomonas aeruginosa TaxID=287 RepID=UPI0031B7E83E